MVRRFFVFNKLLRAFCILTLLFSVQRAAAFSLLGPFTPWMTSALDYQDGFSIGGPMNLGEGYRWNVPMITYAFDESFVGFFGSNGVAAVERAIEILNNLPAASALEVDSFPSNSTLVNFASEAQDLVDLKSATLYLLLEQMGLAQPQRFTFTLRDFSVVNSVTNYSVLMRNFDPVSLAPSTSVNGTVYTSNLVYYPGLFADVQEFPVDPMAPTRTAVAEGPQLGGNFLNGLTRDDAGGIRYLLRTNQFAVETLLPGVRGSGTNAADYVATALRAGIDKITWMRATNYSVLAGQIVPPITNQYLDHYLTNSALRQQSLERVISKPDVLFTAHFAGIPLISRTGTTNWINNNLLNGGPAQNGPGNIQPGITINFNPRGRTIVNFSGVYPPPDFVLIQSASWGSYDNSTNAPVSYPVAATNLMHFYLLLMPATTLSAAPLGTYQSDLPGAPGAQFVLQTSTNLTDWTEVTTITNTGGNFTYIDRVFEQPAQRYFRTVPK